MKGPLTFVTNPRDHKNLVINRVVPPDIYTNVKVCLYSKYPDAVVLAPPIGLIHPTLNHAHIQLRGDRFLTWDILVNNKRRRIYVTGFYVCVPYLGKIEIGFGVIRIFTKKQEIYRSAKKSAS